MAARSDRPFCQGSGFLCPLEPELKLPSKLPSKLNLLESIISDLPRLLRTGSVRFAICSLPCFTQAVQDIPGSCLPRASIILSCLAHAFKFEERHIGHNGSSTSSSLPDDLLCAWGIISRQLGYGAPRRMIEDDLLNNCIIKDDDAAKLAVPYFDIPEEHMSAGIQVAMEHKFAPVPGAMMDAARHVADLGSEEKIAGCLVSICRGILDCAETFLNVPHASCHGPNHFDPVVWGKTYPEIGRPVVPGELTNSGVNSPLFHAIDCFLGIMGSNVSNELLLQQAKRRSLLPLSVQQFLHTLDQSHESIHHYIRSHPNGPAANSLTVLLQTYAWLLERHRMRAVGFTPVVLASGRQQTAGGLPQSSLVSPADILDTQIKRAMVARFGSGIPKLTVKVESRFAVGSKTTCLTILVPCCPPIEPGDTIQIWPEAIKSDFRLSKTPKNFEPVPRYYSIAMVQKMTNQTTRLFLTIAGSSGHSGEFLCSLQPGFCLETVLTPRPDFRCPTNGAQPMLLIAQGAGIGPFLGFLYAKCRLSALEDRRGNIILIIAAKDISSVPYLQTLCSFTRILSLELHLAISNGYSCMIKDGKVHTSRKGKRTPDILFDISESIKTRVLDLQGHIFVSGSGLFGHAIHNSLESLDLLPLSAENYHDACRGGNSQGNIPNQKVLLIELSRHNKPSDLWVAIQGVVYDLTKFGTYHPGGLKTILDVAGTVADKRFFQIHSPDTNQGLLSRVQPYAIGILEQCDPTSKRMCILTHITKKQNALTNSTQFAPGRTVPLYVFFESLAVCWTSFDGIARFVKGEGLDKRLLTELDSLSSRLSTECWQYMAMGPNSLEEKETLVRERYAVYWVKCQCIFDGLKDVCCSGKGDCEEEGLQEIIYAYLEARLQEVVAFAANPFN